MIDSDIYKYVTQFKSAIIRARDDGLFDKDISFYRFPRACCGDACYLLAEYLCARGIETIYVWGDYKRQSHAWLVVKDQRVKIPIKKQIEIPMEIHSLLKQYSGNHNENVFISNYDGNDINEGLIIDITADQFGAEPIYCDYLGDFHRRFKFIDAHDYMGLGTSRLEWLYEIIMGFID